MAASKGDGIWGYFELLGEQTQGMQDVKEGTYLRTNITFLESIDLPLTDHNKWPQQKDFPNFRPAVESNFSAVYHATCALTRCISTKLGWEPNYFVDNVISRFAYVGMFRYHQDQKNVHQGYGVGQHSDPAVFSMVTSDDGM